MDVLGTVIALLVASALVAGGVWWHLVGRARGALRRARELDAADQERAEAEAARVHDQAVADATEKLEADHARIEAESLDDVVDWVNARLRGDR